MGRLSRIPEIEQKVGKPILRFLKEAIESGKKPPEIAELAGVSQSQVYELIKKFNLSARLKEVSRKAIYQGGESELKSIIDNFLRAKEIGELSPKTISSYRDALYAYLRWLEKTEKPTTILAFSTEYLRDYSYYLKTEAQRYGKSFTASTRHAYHRVLRAFGNWLEKEGVIEKDKNPMNRVEIPKVGQRKPEDIPLEVIDKILSSFDNSFTEIRNMTVLSMFLDTGMRLNDVVMLEASQFDLNSGKANIIGKGNKERLVHLTPSMLEILKGYLALRNPIAKTTKLWINQDGSWFKRDSLRKMISALSKTVPGYRIHPHLFRHVWAKAIAESGANLLAIADMGGWEDLELVKLYASAVSVEKAFKEYATASPLHQLLKGKLV